MQQNRLTPRIPTKHYTPLFSTHVLVSTYSNWITVWWTQHALLYSIIFLQTSNEPQCGMCIVNSEHFTTNGLEKNMSTIKSMIKTIHHVILCCINLIDSNCLNKKIIDFNDASEKLKSPSFMEAKIDLKWPNGFWREQKFEKFIILIKNNRQQTNLNLSSVSPDRLTEQVKCYLGKTMWQSLQSTEQTKWKDTAFNKIDHFFVQIIHTCTSTSFGSPFPSWTKGTRYVICNLKNVPEM